jgi:1-acyl-sn-glycerol-3-phosphate acyltransferase
MARLTLVLLGFWPCCGIRRSGLDGQSPAQWASGAVLVVSNHVSWLDILVSASPLCLGSLFPSLNLSTAGGY